MKKRSSRTVCSSGLKLGFSDVIVKEGVSSDAIVEEEIAVSELSNSDISMDEVQDSNVGPITRNKNILDSPPQPGQVSKILDISFIFIFLNTRFFISFLRTESTR